MPTILKRFVAAQVPASATVLYSAAAGVKARVDAMTVTNKDVAARTVTVWLPDSGASADSNIVLLTKSLPAGSSYVVREAIGHSVSPGGSIVAQADVAGQVTMAASGIEAT